MTERWAETAIDRAAFEQLAEGLPPTQLFSLLLAVLERRAALRRPADLVGQLARDGFVQPASADQRTLHAIDAALLASASVFDAVELSPLAPLGVCSTVGLTSQNKIVSALRGTEVVSDPTNVLALLCAERLKRDPDAIVRLCTSHRCVRAQQVPKIPGFAPHFRMFALASAGVEQREHAVVVAALIEHIRTLRAGIAALAAAGHPIEERGVRVLATGAKRGLGEAVAAAVGASRVDALEHAYYAGLRYQIDVALPNGTMPLVDGGAFDWLEKIASNRRLVFVASGLGSQLVAHATQP